MKSNFDRFIQIATVIFVPLSIAFAGHLFGIQLKNAEIASQERRFEVQHNLELAKQEADWRITKSELVLQFMDALASPDPMQRKIAVEAILIALPEDGPRIAEVVANSDPDSDVQDVASSSMDRQVSRIVNEMFSDAKSTRVGATELAVSGWLNNANFTETLLNKVTQDISNSDGVWNAIIYLENASAEHLRQYRASLEQLEQSLSQRSGRDRTLQRLRDNVLSKI